MTDYNKGDLIEATHTDGTVVRTPVTGFDEGMAYTRLGSFYGPDWTITLLKAVEPPLPTEPGYYLDKDEELWQLVSGGDWKFLLDSFVTGPQYFLPFTKLEPVTETARKVLARVATIAWADGFANDLKALRDYFGVTDD